MMKWNSMEGDTIHTGVVNNLDAFWLVGDDDVIFFFCAFEIRASRARRPYVMLLRAIITVFGMIEMIILSSFVKARKNMKNDETFRPPSWEWWRLVCLVQFPTKNHDAYSSASSSKQNETQTCRTRSWWRPVTCSLSTIYNSHERTKQQQLDLVLWFLFSQRVWHETSRM